jgi:hypothetical protein
MPIASPSLDGFSQVGILSQSPPVFRKVSAPDGERYPRASHVSKMPPPSKDRQNIDGTRDRKVSPAKAALFYPFEII